MYLIITPLKFNSSPLKSYRAPIGKACLPLPPFFRVELLNFGGGGVVFWGASGLQPRLKCAAWLPQKTCAGEGHCIHMIAVNTI